MSQPVMTGSPTRRDARTAGLILVVGLAAIALGLTGEVSLLGRTSSWWHVLPLLTGCVAVAVQNRWPRTALVVAVGGLAATGFREWSLGAVAVALEVLYTAARRQPWSFVYLLRRCAIAVGVVVTISVAAVARDVPSVANAGLLVFAVLGTPLWWGADVRRQADLTVLTERNAAHAREHAIRAERARMARDLHDAVAGDLASIALHSEAGLRQTRADDPARESLATIRRSGLRAMGELTTMIQLLRRDAGDEVVVPPGLDALPQLIEHAEASGLSVSLIQDTRVELPVVVDHAAYRILQEAFTNALRHGAPGVAAVRIHASEELQVEMLSEMNNDGRKRKGSGMGMVTMRERAEGLGGTFSAGPEGEKWRVSARIPLPS